eukprot:CAMPEP_0119011700 /NCGR_PEP_ID=MMETSP1176-20130426/5837_1 /TAXON_ID=265551 /ORGANISM="Synedropsis recta cf, Strain CCMP1620" /LENGTH=78 /DNA_ID=CAMNT_0006964557 /DNA_START=162 /DNA_END=398 /DNA_ORIENTATION=-
MTRLRVYQFSTEAAAAAPPKKASGGASLFQRLTSFLIGAGLTALGTQYFIYEEIHEGNKMILAKQKELEKRLHKLDKK